MSSLQIGKAIFQILNQVQPKKVFPLIADEGTTYPFIVYRRSSLTPASTKDRFNYKEIASVEIMIADNTYNGSIQLSEEVRNKLEGIRGNFNGINIADSKLISADERYLEDAFVQNLIFSFELF